MTKCFIALTVFLLAPFSAFATEPEPSADGKHLFILSGQSNMRQPLPDAFRESVEKVFGRDKVIVVTLSHPSQPIKRWYKDWTPPEGEITSTEKAANGTLYDGLLKAVKRATAGKEPASVTYIWMQGEADAGSGWGSVYEKSFYGVLEQFKEDLKLKEINYVIGRINDHWLTEKGIRDGDLVRAVQVKMGGAVANADWVNTDDLNTGMNPWGIYEIDGGHFPSPAYKVLGQRFARKACKLIDPEMKPDDRFFGAVFLDTVDGVESHIAIGRKISSPTEETTGKELAALLDGKHGSTNHEDGNWIAFAPDREGIELLVDLGESQSVTGIGADLLINNNTGAGFPKKMVVSVSDDGVDFQPVHNKGITFFYKDSLRKKALANFRPQSLLIYVDTPARPARYIKVGLATGSSQVLLDEIVVNPVAKSDLVRHADQW